MQKPAFLLAAPSSGSGKTTLSVALMRILSDRGLKVQPFKCGPDYLDTRLHTLASGCRSLNLDSFMASERHIRELFLRKSAVADAVVVEGVMGLFDGAVKADGSSASVARLLDLPVVLVVDAKGVAYSIAPLLYGFRNFDPDVRLAGVIFNRVNSGSHYRFLEDACHDVGVEPLGYVPRNESMAVPERYLGLAISPDAGQEQAIRAMADHVAKTVDVDRLLQIAMVDLPDPERENKPGVPSSERVIAVARDEAFTFLYAENLDVLSRFGKIVFFSPLHDERLPECDMLYLAGGYPELYASALSSNGAMRRQIAEFSHRDGVVYAECGGMMYLGSSMTDRAGDRYPMCGVLDLDTSMQEARLHPGYRRIRLDDPRYSSEIRGHEFHYSCIARKGDLQNIARVTSARNQPVDTEIYRYRHTVASYIHQYRGDAGDFAQYLVNDC